MVGAVLFAFLLGLSVGILIGRRNPRAKEDTGAPAAPAVTPSLLGGRSVGPTKRGRKAGLTEADFTPSDDILERLRKAAEGELDPSEIEAPSTTGPGEGSAEADALRRAELAEKERRVLERLRQLEAEGETDAEADGTET